MFTRRCQRLQIYAHKKQTNPSVSLSSANPRAAARRENPKTPTSIIIHPPSSRPRARSLVDSNVPWSARTCDHRGTCYRTPPGPRGGYHRPERAGFATPRDRFPTIPPRSGDRRGCTRRTPTTRRKHETIHITSVFVSSSSRASSHRASRDVDHRLFPSSRPRARDPPHLTVVLVQPGVHGVHDVRTNRGQENFRQGARRAVAALDGDHGKRGRHGVGRARRGKAERETRRDEGFRGVVWAFLSIWALGSWCMTTSCVWYV